MFRIKDGLGTKKRRDVTETDPPGVVSKAHVMGALERMNTKVHATYVPQFLYALTACEVNAK